MNKLLLELSGFHPVSPALEEFLRARVIIQTFKKNEVILKAGRICGYVYFIEKGLVRHEVVEGGRSYTPWILKEGDIVTSVDSFFFQVPAIDSIIAIEETTLIFLSNEDLGEGCRLHPELAIIREKVKEKYYALKESRDRRLGLLDKPARYRDLLKSDPELTIRAPVQILSSYLHMSPKWLYKIRNRLSRGM